MLLNTKEIININMQIYMPKMSIQFYTRRISFIKRMVSEIFQIKLQNNSVNITLDTKKL